MSNHVHIFGLQFSTFCRSIMLYCEEKNIKYTIGLSIGDKTIELKSEAHFDLHPFGKFPVLIDGENTLFETATICRYLDEKYSGTPLQLTNINKKAIIDQWSAAISTYIDKALVRDYLLEFAFPKGKDGAIRMEVLAEAEPQVINILKKLELLLADNEFICGEQYSIADALLTPILDYLFFLPVKDHLFQSVPKLNHYTQRMQQRLSGVKILTHKAK